MTHQIRIGKSVAGDRQRLVLRERQTGYGSVPGLDDSELANPEELERQVVLDMWGPILALPELGRRTGFRPVIDESGHRDWGAFGTADFERLYGGFNKALYKADKLGEELRRTLIALEIIGERVPANAKCQVLRYLDAGVIDFEDIDSLDMQAVARRYLRAKRLRREIRELRERSRGMRLAEAQ